MPLNKLIKLTDVLDREGFKVISIEDAHIIGPGHSEITSLNGEAVKAEGHMMVEIQVIIPVHDC